MYLSLKLCLNVHHLNHMYLLEYIGEQLTDMGVILAHTTVDQAKAEGESVKMLLMTPIETVVTTSNIFQANDAVLLDWISGGYL